MIRKIPWISEIKSKESLPGILIDTKRLIEFLRSTQNPDDFYNSLDKTFFAIIGLLKFDQSSDINQNALISHI